MNLRAHQICELLEDGADISKRLFAAQKTVERMANTNADILRELVAELRRLRISQLRRMADAADAQRDELQAYRITSDAPIGSFHWRMARHKWWLAKFVAACLAEIERLRGMG